MNTHPPRFRLPRSHRLSGAKQFEAVFASRVRKTLGPIAVCGRANGLPHGRLGLSVPRRVGSAVKRNRIKRLLREAYRLDQNELPVGYDWVVVVRPHEALALAEYRHLFMTAAASVHRRLSASSDRP